MENPPTFQGYNPNSQSVRRILREYKEMAQETSTLFKAAPLEVRSILIFISSETSSIFTRGAYFPRFCCFASRTAERPALSDGQ